MRLINVQTLAIEEFIGSNIPKYAILSHTWGSEEVSFQDWQDISRASQKRGFFKIQGACQLALKDGFQYVWVDTNCIDKTSSAELSEAINSMFAWYRDAARCYVYLADTPYTKPESIFHLETILAANDPFRRSKWFTRGWTLQELLAPQVVVFYSAEWKEIGTKTELRSTLSLITGVEPIYLVGTSPLWVASAAKRMSWVSKRVTTRVEDLAYCMLGIFEINMPLLYGEGSRAFVRLQEEILKHSNDQSIFCWEWKDESIPGDWGSVLAPCPATFEHSGDFYTATLDDDENDDDKVIVPYNITNSGLFINLRCIQTGNPDFVFGVLQVCNESRWYRYNICIPLEKGRIHRRLPFPALPFPLPKALAGEQKPIYIFSSIRNPTRGLAVFRGAEDSWDRSSISHKIWTGFLVTLETIRDEPLVAKLVNRTRGMAFLKKESVLGVTLGDEGTLVGVFEITHSSIKPFIVILAATVRKGFDGTPSFTFGCQVKDKPGLPLTQLVREAENTFRGVGHDIDNSVKDNGMVSLGDEIDYSSHHDHHRGLRLRLAHIEVGQAYSLARS